MRIRIICLCLLIGSVAFIHAQKPNKPSSGDLYMELQKLNFLGTALYIAAHPDDENTGLISYLSNGMHARTGYLSLTRGDGGQNLVGTEIGAKLGLIRTNELLEARKIDGGVQFFSRAIDFGYSKHSDETLAIWNKSEVLHDMVRVIRKFRPDIIINRFDHRTPGETHGHHTSSAILSLEASDLAADTSAFKDRLGGLESWSVKNTYFNTSWWFYGSRENFEAADKSNMISVNVGPYYALKGLSNMEIAALSRSSHKSQGFGATGSRGVQYEYLELINGDQLPAEETNLFYGVNTTWSRVSGGAAIGAKIQDILDNFNFVDPSVHIPVLLQVYEDIEGLDDAYWREQKLSELKEIISSSLGLFVEARVDQATAVRGESIRIDVEVTSRSGVPVIFRGMTVTGAAEANIEAGEAIGHNEKRTYELTATIKNDAGISNPYWLENTGSLGMYDVMDPDMIGRPMPPASLMVDFNLQVGSVDLVIQKDVVFKRNDPVKGEVYAPFFIVPDVSVSFSDPVYIFSDRNAKEVVIEVKSFKDNLKGQLSLDHPGSWIVQPTEYNVSLPKKGTVARFPFTVKGPLLSASSEFGIFLRDSLGHEFINSVAEISYDHIPELKIISLASAKFERISLMKSGDKIAYIEGAGDDIPKSLRQIGYEVDMLEIENISFQQLKTYDAVVLGIRAYNVKPQLKLKKDHLLQYIYDGGTVITQYNTNRGIGPNDLGPYIINLSRDRVTDENAVMSMELPEHEVLNYPNKITSRDFDGWVQERGLYFANEWDFRYQAPLSSADPGESLKSGGLLICPFGKGHFIYTGLSWFRELPAGVPGAYRLFTNLLSIGKNNIPEKNEEDSNNK